MTDLVRSITLRVIQESVLTAVESSKKYQQKSRTDLVHFFFLMESHDERGTTRGKGESAEDNNMYSVFYVCQWKRYTECEFKLACVSL